MMKVRCNDSIKRLITSSEYRYDDGMTVEQRFNSIPSQFEMSREELKRYAGLANNSVKEDGIPNKVILVPFGFLTETPKGFDRTKSRESSVDIVLDYRLGGNFQTMSENIQNEIDWSAVHNNLGESILLGRAVYSWVRQTNSLNLKRETESHLPNGDYDLQIYLALFSVYNDGKCTIKWVQDPMFIKLTVVSKKANKNESKKRSSNVDPDETVESLLAECDNMK